MYRDGTHAIRDQARSLEMRLEALLRSLGMQQAELVRPLLARHLGKARRAAIHSQLERIVALTPSEGASADRWLAHCDRLGELVATLEAVETSFAEWMRNEAFVLPEDVPRYGTALEVPPPRSDQFIGAHVRAFVNVLSDPPDELLTSPTSGALRFRRLEVPFAASFSGAPIRSTLATSVAPAADDLEVVPDEGFVERFVRGRRSVDVGDIQFDGMFDVRGDVGWAKHVLTPPVRKALKRVAHWDVPTLHIGEGRAEIAFAIELGHPTDREVVHTALDALAGVRAASVTRQRG